MTAALTPALALDFLRELSADFRAGIVLAVADDERLAGPEVLAEPARGVLRDAPEATAITARTVHGGVFAARDGRHAIVLAMGPFALPGLVHHDLRTVLEALGGAPKSVEPVTGSSAEAQRLLSVVSSLS